MGYLKEHKYKKHDNCAMLQEAELLLSLELWLEILGQHVGGRHLRILKEEQVCCTPKSKVILSLFA